MSQYTGEDLERCSGLASTDDGDARHQFQKDRDKLIYSSFLRRMAGKSQVVGSGERGNFHNRLTHSLKVAQVGRRLAERHGLDPDLVEAVCLAHDIGHPPFGHAGEKALRESCDAAARQLLKSIHKEDELPRTLADVSFEGNAQNLRIVANLAVQYLPGVADGLDLTRATLDGMSKYGWLRSDVPAGEDRKPKWGVYSTEEDLFEWVIGGSLAYKQPRCVEAEAMDWADDVTFAVHDVEDFYRAGLIPLERLFNYGPPISSGESTRPSLPEEAERYLGWYEDKRGKELKDDAVDHEFLIEVWRELASHVVVESPFRVERVPKALTKRTTSNLISHFTRHVSVDGCRRRGVFRISTSDEHAVRLRVQNNLLKNLVFKYVIEEPRLAVLQSGQARIIHELFTAYYDGADGMLPPERRELIVDGNGVDRIRAVRDYLASLTEQDAYTLYHQITGIEVGSVLSYVAE